MSDKRKVKGTKPTGQQKSAGRDHNNDLAQDVVADKENSQTSSEWPRPRPRPIKKSTVSEHTDKSETQKDEGASAAMAVEALLSIQNGNPSPATNLKARGSSPIEHVQWVVKQLEVLPGYEEDSDLDIYDRIEMELTTWVL